MRQIVLASAVVALTAAVPLAMERAEAQSYLPPGAAPPWATTPTTTTETTPAPTPSVTPAADQPSQSPATAESGSTTPTHAVFLHAAPSGTSPILGTLHPGESLRVLTSAPGGWMQVESPSGSGWAYGSYLAHPGSAAAAAPQETNPR